MRPTAIPALLVLPVVAAGCASLPAASSLGNDSAQLLSVDHYVRVRSTAPSMNGQSAQLYVRERVEGRGLLHGSPAVVVFVHGRGTPAEVAFDVPYGHNAMWERNHAVLFQASLEWLAHGTVNGTRSGMLQLGYDKEQKDAN